MRHSRWGEFLTAAAASAAFLPLSAAPSIAEDEQRIFAQIFATGSTRIGRDRHNRERTRRIDAPKGRSVRNFFTTLGEAGGKNPAGLRDALNAGKQAIADALR